MQLKRLVVNKISKIFFISFLFLNSIDSFCQSELFELCGDNANVKISNITLGEGFFTHIEFVGKLNDGKWVYYENCRSLRKKRRTILLEGEYLNGLKNGVFNYYSRTYKFLRSTSKLSFSLTYKNGILNGPFTSFGKDGRKREITNFTDGEIDGFFILFDSNKITENIISIRFYKKGKLLYESYLNNEDEMGVYKNYELK